MRKAVLFLAVVIVAAMAVAIFWYGDAKAAEPKHNKDVAVGDEINWTISPDPDCNASLFTDSELGAVDEKMKITINYADKNNGLVVLNDNQVYGDVKKEVGYSDRHPFYIYVDVVSEVSRDGAFLCWNFRWWQINVIIPVYTEEDGDKFGLD